MIDTLIERKWRLEERISQHEIAIVGLKESLEEVEEQIRQEQEKEHAAEDIAWRQMKL